MNRGNEKCIGAINDEERGTNLVYNVNSSWGAIKFFFIPAAFNLLLVSRG